MRRTAVLGLLVVTPLLAACGSSTPAEPDASTDGGASPDTSVADSGPKPDAADAAPVPIPIKHVVIIVKENHTFDNYFGSFPGAEGISQIQTKNSGTIKPPQAPNRTLRDLCHQHDCALTDWVRSNSAAV